jgi:hypothetical protein
MKNFESAAQLPEPGMYCCFLLHRDLVGSVSQTGLNTPQELDDALAAKGITGAVQYDGTTVWHNSKRVAEVAA